jgi:hypothetical protein
LFWFGLFLVALLGYGIWWLAKTWWDWASLPVTAIAFGMGLVAFLGGLVWRRLQSPAPPSKETGRRWGLGDAIREEMRGRAAGGGSVTPSPEVVETIEEIVLRRKRGESLEQIRKELDLSRSTVRSVVEGYGLLSGINGGA